MEKDITILFNELQKKYAEINRISDWNSLHAANDLDQINSIVDKREQLLQEIRVIDETIGQICTVDDPVYTSGLKEVKHIIKEIIESDKSIMNRISNRMNEIREELRVKSLFRTRALPGYIKQKYAFSR